MRVKNITIDGEDREVSTINLLVGSNNTGKSTLLREIYNSLMNRVISITDSRWIERLQVEVSDFKTKIDGAFVKLGQYDDFSQIDYLDQRSIAEAIGFTPFRNNMRQNLRSYGLSNLLSSDLYRSNATFQIAIEQLYSSEQVAQTQEMQGFKVLADIGVANEFCDSRLGANFVTSVQDILQDGDADQSPVRHLRENQALLGSIQENIQEVFGIKIGFDNLEQGQKPLRILPSEKISKKLTHRDAAKEWHDKSPLIDSQGDGLRAYLKLALSLLDDFSNIVCIDEPETFLHPPQRRALGGLMARMAKNYNKQLFVATHDSELIRGLLSAGNDVRVFNLRNMSGVRTVVDIDLRDIKSIVEQRGNKLKERVDLLKESALNALFYDKTILTESENDRFFYEYYASLRHRGLLQSKQFIGLTGVDQVPVMAQKLHGIGVNVACIMDIDFLITRYAPGYIKDSYPDLHTRHIAVRQAYDRLPGADRDKFRKNLKKKGLSSIVDEDQRAAYGNLIDAYADVGVYIPETGELESWTKTSKNNLSQMLRVVEGRNPRELNRFMKLVLS